jgi:hypothetical protein
MVWFTISCCHCSVYARTLWCFIFYFSAKVNTVYSITHEQRRNIDHWSIECLWFLKPFDRLNFDSFKDKLLWKRDRTNPMNDWRGFTSDFRWRNVRIALLLCVYSDHAFIMYVSSIYASVTSFYPRAIYQRTFFFYARDKLILIGWKLSRGRHCLSNPVIFKS